MKKILWLLPFLAFGCKKKDVTPAVPSSTQLNVSYGTDPLQKMDIYLPEGRSVATTKVIIMVHGGGWSEGDKIDFTPYVDSLKKRLPGYAIFNINYRLAVSGTNLFPTQELDVKAAFEFIYNKRADYKISDKFVALGASAGGHLALQQSYKNNSVVKVKAVVDFFGPTELYSMYTYPINPLIPLQLIAVIGGNPATKAQAYHDGSPYNYVTAQCPPTIILQGGADIVVDYTQSVILRDKLITSGVTNQYVFYPSENHGWTGANLTDSFDKITAFLNAYVN